MVAGAVLFVVCSFVRSFVCLLVWERRKKTTGRGRQGKKPGNRGREQVCFVCLVVCLFVCLLVCLCLFV